MTAPYRRNTLESIVGNILDRLRILEATPAAEFAQRAMYEIKLAPDDEAIPASAHFIFAVPLQLNGWSLTAAAGFVSAVSTSGEVSVQVENLTTSDLMLDDIIIIDEGEFTSYTGPPVVFFTANVQVSTGNRLEVRVVQPGVDAEGLGVILEFSPPTA